MLCSNSYSVAVWGRNWDTTFEWNEISWDTYLLPSMLISTGSERWTLSPEENFMEVGRMEIFAMFKLRDKSKEDCERREASRCIIAKTSVRFSLPYSTLLNKTSIEILLCWFGLHIQLNKNSFMTMTYLLCHTLYHFKDVTFINAALCESRYIWIISAF